MTKDANLSFRVVRYNFSFTQRREKELRVAFIEIRKNDINYILLQSLMPSHLPLSSLDAPANGEVACLSLGCLPSQYFFVGEVLPYLPISSKYLEKY